MYEFSPELRAAYEAMPVPMVFSQYTDGRVVPLLFSDGFCALVNLSRDYLVRWFPNSQFERVHPDDAGLVASVSESFARHQSEYDLVFRCRHEDGYHYIHAVGHWQTMPDGSELAVLTYADVSRAEREIMKVTEQYGLFQKDQFYRDPLTGLPNINYLHQFAEERVSSIRSEDNKPVLLFTDVNSMQFYNNQYGMEQGNELLRLIAETLRKHFPRALLIRGYDDHFILLDVWRGEEHLARTVRQVCREIRTGAYGKTAGIQIGVCIVEEGMSALEAIDHARSAVKRIGSNLNAAYRIHSRVADEAYWNERYIVQTLDRALEENWIRVFYQGICRVRTGKTVAMEALSRWNDPDRGTILPGEFTPVLEKYHLLHRLDLYMFEQICREVPLRQEAGLPLVPVSVNFSAQDFDYLDVPGEIDRIYERYGMSRYVPRDYFIIEVTEQDIAVATDRFYQQLQVIRKKGYRLWMDDFGSGYSSLNVLARFNADLIKFDMALLHNLDLRGGLNRKIFRAMISIAREMQVQTLAEGVESQEQLDFLREIGCEFCQGFYLRKPESLNTILFMLSCGQIAPQCETARESEIFLRPPADE